MRIFATFFAALLLLLTAVVTANHQSTAAAGKPLDTFIYINNNDFENSVSGFRATDDGRLQLLAGSPYLTGGFGGKKSDVGSIVVSKKARLLFATNNADDTVSSFRINADGTLARTGELVATGGRFATGIVCNKQGTRLFVANVGSDSISVFDVDAAGKMLPITGSPFPAGNGPIDLAINKNGTLLFASLQFSHSIGVYQISAGGALQQLSTTVTPGLTNHGLSLNLTTARLYVAELGNNSVSGFNVDLTNGALSAMPNLPYFTDGSEPIAVTSSKNGSFVFVSNNSNATISVFAANADGSLRAVTGSPFSTDREGPAGIAINRRGTLLFVANGGFTNAGDVSVYRIAATGAIAPVAGSPFSTNSFGVPTAITILETPVLN